MLVITVIQILTNVLLTIFTVVHMENVKIPQVLSIVYVMMIFVDIIVNY